ncbi:hybrid sensor histidine kinase/response regulator [Herbaspirillum robiniae]|nr:ATP-binding protein [Herbaspirillum robiniae]
MMQDPLVHSAAAASGRSEAPRVPQVEDKTAELREALAIVEAQKRQLEIELEDARLLHGISSMMADEDSVDALYQKLVDAATLVMRSDFGSMQRYDRARGELELIAHHGLNEDAVRFWQWVYPGRATTCGKALETGKRVIVRDFENCDYIVGSDDLEAFRKAGVRAAQSTPLLTRNGNLVGMITTHWTHCHEPKERDLRLFDIIARQAADLIERNTTMQALQLQTQSLLEADRYKDEFLATLAHELRNPLAPIRTGLTLLKIGKPGQEARILPMMERQLGHMVRLIDDLLDVSRISRGVVALKPGRVSLGAIIDSAVETSRPLINAASHKFTVTVPGNEVWLEVDETRIAQVISNLLNNAAKYTPHGGQIALVAEVADDAISVRVIDNGIGIPASMLPRIFDLFTQVDKGSERSQTGLGVGLALARHLAEMHGGRIDVASDGDDAGSVFTLRLPASVLAVPEAPAGGEPARGQVAADPLRILIVDDNVDAAESLALLLNNLGHTTGIVLESPKAVATALEFRPDVMFLDIGMPYLNGFDLARDIRSNEALGGVYLAALSGWGTDEDRARSRAAGIDCHMTKPALADDVEKMLSGAGRQSPSRSAGMAPDQIVR